MCKRHDTQASGRPRKSLGEVLAAQGDHAIRFCIPDANKPGKPKERVTSAAEKIVILVRCAIVRFGRVGSGGKHTSTPLQHPVYRKPRPSLCSR